MSTKVFPWPQVSPCSTPKTSNVPCSAKSPSIINHIIVDSNLSSLSHSSLRRGRFRPEKLRFLIPATLARFIYFRFIYLDNFELNQSCTSFFLTLARLILLYRDELNPWVKGTVFLVLEFALSPFSPRLPSVVEVSKQNTH